ncbi:MAG TPA: hypothetical protein VM532_14665 [Burkholderiales bacterium]|nr:hypothetical protein [Burkholderiales bacterium]
MESTDTEFATREITVLLLTSSLSTKESDANCCFGFQATSHRIAFAFLQKYSQFFIAYLPPLCNCLSSSLLFRPLNQAFSAMLLIDRIGIGFAHEQETLKNSEDWKQFSST